MKINFVGEYPPSYATVGSTGADVRAQAVHFLQPHTITLVGTGCYVDQSYMEGQGNDLQLRPKSGLAAKGIEAVLGTIDSDYALEIKVILKNTTDFVYLVQPGDKVGQLVLCAALHISGIEVLLVERTGGFGSTNVK